MSQVSHGPRKIPALRHKAPRKWGPATFLVQDRSYLYLSSSVLAYSGTYLGGSLEEIFRDLDYNLSSLLWPSMSLLTFRQKQTISHWTGRSAAGGHLLRRMLCPSMFYMISCASLFPPVRQWADQKISGFV